MLKLIRGLSDPAAPAQPDANPLKIAKMVAWSFFGVRKRAGLESDASAITPLQVMVAGVLATAVFVATLLVIVRLVMA